MIDGSEKRNHQLAFELQNLHVCEKRSKVIPEEKQLLVEEKDADNIRKVLCKVVLRITLVLL